MSTQPEPQPQAETQPENGGGSSCIDFDSDAPLERPAEGQACSLEPGCESCQ